MSQVTVRSSLFAKLCMVVVVLTVVAIGGAAAFLKWGKPEHQLLVAHKIGVPQVLIDQFLPSQEEELAEETDEEEVVEEEVTEEVVVPDAVPAAGYEDTLEVPVPVAQAIVVREVEAPVAVETTVVEVPAPVVVAQAPAAPKLTLYAAEPAGVMSPGYHTDGHYPVIETVGINVPKGYVLKANDLQARKTACRLFKEEDYKKLGFNGAPYALLTGGGSVFNTPDGVQPSFNFCAAYPGRGFSLRNYGLNVKWSFEGSSYYNYIPQGKKVVNLVVEEIVPAQAEVIDNNGL